MLFTNGEWIQYPNETFLLRVKGDSMAQANIDNGDYVMIRQQLHQMKKLLQQILMGMRH